MIADGELQRDVVDGVSYLWPEDASGPCLQVR